MSTRRVRLSELADPVHDVDRRPPSELVARARGVVGHVLSAGISVDHHDRSTERVGNLEYAVRLVPPEGLAVAVPILSDRDAPAGQVTDVRERPALRPGGNHFEWLPGSVKLLELGDQRRVAAAPDLSRTERIVEVADS